LYTSNITGMNHLKITVFIFKVNLVPLRNWELSSEYYTNTSMVENPKRRLLLQ